MADYTHEFSNFPDSLIVQKTYKDITDDIAGIVAQVENAKRTGDFATAVKLLNDHPELNDYNFSAIDINRIVEEVRNTQIYAQDHTGAITYGGNYFEGEEGDLWMGDPLPDTITKTQITKEECQSLIDAASYDTTEQCTVQSYDGNDVYTVKKSDESTYQVLNSTGNAIEVGSLVRVTVPMNNLVQAYISSVIRHGEEPIELETPMTVFHYKAAESAEYEITPGTENSETVPSATGAAINISQAYEGDKEYLYDILISTNIKSFENEPVVIDEGEEAEDQPTEGDDVVSDTYNSGLKLEVFAKTTDESTPVMLGRKYIPYTQFTKIFNTVEYRIKANATGYTKVYPVFTMLNHKASTNTLVKNGFNVTYGANDFNVTVTRLTGE